jgi:hypothetical protein
MDDFLQSPVGVREPTTVGSEKMFKSEQNPELGRTKRGHGTRRQTGISHHVRRAATPSEGVKPDEAALPVLVVLECRDPMIPLPEFHIVAVNQLPGAHFRSLVILANKIEALPYAAVRIENVGAIFAHLRRRFQAGRLQPFAQACGNFCSTRLAQCSLPDIAMGK